MSMMEIFNSDVYEDGRTKQAFEEQTDVNRIMARAAKGETITHLAKYGAVYGDFSDIDDLLTASARLNKGVEIFKALPGEIKREFHNSPGEFFNYVNNPENKDKLHEVLPGLAKPGSQMPTPVRKAENQKEPEPNLPPPAEKPPQANTEPPPAG
ncbi:internal scaffolding protein [Microviridae sp.]|nr:internal scaffolding protein [Microviridae sp.]